MDEESWAVLHRHEGQVRLQRRNRLESAYGPVALQILDALIAIDPLRLVQDGDTGDGYLHEANLLCIRLESVNTANEVVGIVEDVLDESLGPPPYDDDQPYTETARRIWEIWHNHEE